MQHSSISRRKLMQLLSVSAIGSLALPKITLADSSKTDYYDEVFNTVHIKKGEGKTGKIGGIDLIAKLSKTQTNGLFACDEATLKPGFLGAPPHLHKTFDEICFVLEGTISILVNNTVYEVNAGDWHLRPRNKMHTFWNTGTVIAKFVDIYIPGGHEEYMADLVKLFENNGRPKKEDFALLEQKHDIVYMWNKLPEIMNTYKVHL